MVRRFLVVMVCLACCVPWWSVSGCSSAPSGDNGADTNSNNNGNDNDSNQDVPPIGNDNSVDNTDDNVPDNTNDNANDNVADNSNDNANDNDNGNDNVDPDTIPGACCGDDGSCTTTTRDGCDGAFVGGGTDCGPTSCTVSPFTDEALDRGLSYQALFPRGAPDVVPGSGLAFLDLDNDRDFDLVALGHIGDGKVGVFEADGTGRFTDRSADAAIAPSTLARGICAADYDDDGDVDLYLSHWEEPNRLIRNDGGFRFTDVTATAGVATNGHGAGCAWGDYDGDGWLDLYTTNYLLDQPNKLFHNLGDGTFEEVGEALGVHSNRRGMQAAFFDFDEDGDQDLYVANDLLGGQCPTCCNEMYVNNGAGAFTKAGDDTGANACLNSMCIAIGDVNNDQTLDMFFTDDSLPPGNILILNQGDGTFVDSSNDAGVRTQNIIGWGGMFIDYDNDAHEELFVTYNTDKNRFFENDGAFPLYDVAAALDLDDEGQSYCTATSDVDNDGDLDFVLWNRQEMLKLYINNEGQKRRWVKFEVIGEGHNKRAVGALVKVSAGGVGQIKGVMGFNNFKGMDEARLHFGLDTARVVDRVDVLWPGGATRTLRNYPGNHSWTLYPPSRLGDADGNGTIDEADRAALDACRGALRPGCEVMDIDGNAIINSDDQTAQ